MWRVTGAYNVFVRLNDGCDSDPQFQPTAAEVEANARDETEGGFFIMELSPPPAAPPILGHMVPVLQPLPASVTPLTSAARVLERPAGDDQPELTPPPANAPIKLGTNASSGSGDLQPIEACTREERHRAELRGPHVAYLNLVNAHDDYCYGPVGSTEQSATDYCAETWEVWFRHNYPIGSVHPCWVYEKRLSAADVHVQVVLSRRMPLIVISYLVYWGLVVLAILWLLVLAARSMLHRFGLAAQRPPTMLNAESADILNLAGGMGLPGTKLAATIQEQYQVDDSRSGKQQQDSDGGVDIGGGLGQRRNSDDDDTTHNVLHAFSMM
mmetsp:Transcript_6663/g.17056  ORF Transcript_6663/g.17056 Transcript_6663/m.17056 type:complete len:326 (+) Transcript_6663:2-979(+)